MKTGYDQHFKKVKQATKSPAFNVKLPPKSNQRRKEKKSSFPVMPLISFLFIAGSGLVFLDNFDSLESYFDKIEIGMGTAHAEEVKAGATVEETSAPATESPAATAAGADQKAIATEAKKIDDADYMFKLAERKKQLDQREIELNTLAEQLEKQKSELNEKLQKLEETRVKISAALEERIKTDDTKVDTLVQMYSNMKPVQAAKIFETMDEDLVIEILGRMKKKNAADILNLIKPEKAQTFAERYTGYRTPASTK